MHALSGLCFNPSPQGQVFSLFGTRLLGWDKWRLSVLANVHAIEGQLFMLCVVKRVYDWLTIMSFTQRVCSVILTHQPLHYSAVDLIVYTSSSGSSVGCNSNQIHVSNAGAKAVTRLRKFPTIYKSNYKLISLTFFLFIYFK